MSTPLATSLYQWLVFLHVLAAMTWLGGLVLLVALSGLIIRARDRSAIVRFSASLRRIGPLILGPSTIAVVSLGAGLVLDSDSWHFGQGWIVLALALFGAAFLIGAAFQSRAVILLRRAVDAADDDLALRQLRRWAWGMRLILLLLVITTWDMVVKPTL